MHLYVDFPDVRVCRLTSLTVSVYGQGTEGPRCFVASVARPSLPPAEKGRRFSYAIPSPVFFYGACLASYWILVYS